MTQYHLKTLNCQQVMHEVLDLKKRPELQFYWTSICSLPDIGNAVFQKQSLELLPTAVCVRREGLGGS